MKRALCTLLLVACSPLEVVELGICGNGVLEPEEHEDCDTYATAPNATCAPAGDIHECRYVCEKPGERGGGCPAGWTCGTDLVCRRPSGELADAEGLSQPGGRWMDLADMDGDVQADLVIVDADRSTVVYLEGGEPQSMFQFPAEVQGPSFIAEASTDDIADLVIPTFDGLSTWRGTSERKLLPASYSYIPLPMLSGAHLFTIDLVPDVVVLPNDQTLALPGKEYLFVADGMGLAGFAEQWEAEETPLPGVDLSKLRRPAVGDFDELTTSALLPPGSATPEEFVLGAEDDAHVTLYRPILEHDPAADAPIRAVLATAPVQIDFIPPMATVGDNVLAVHLNAPESGLMCGSVPAPVDDHLDLLIDVVGGNQMHGTLAAFGAGDGRFHSDPCTLGTEVPDNRADQLAWLQCGALLAAGDFDGDAFVDVATFEGIWLSSLSNPPRVHDCNSEGKEPHVASYDQKWKAARLGDFDGNTLTDLVAIDGGRGLHVILTSTTTTPTIRQVPSNAPIEQMEVGDFDGNGADDVAYVELGPKDSLSILFGESYAPPSSPSLVTTADEIVGFTPVDMTRFAQPTSDGANELNLVTRLGDKVEAAILWGRTDRQIHAPLLVWPETFEQPYLPVTAAVGHFEASIEQQVLFTAAVRENVAPQIAGYAIAGANEMIKLQVADLPAFATSINGGTSLAVDLDGGGVDTPLAIGWRFAPRSTLVVGPDGPGSWTVHETPFEFVDVLPLGTDGLAGEEMINAFGEWSRHVDADVRSCSLEPDGLPTAMFVGVKPNDCGHTTALYLLDASFLAAALNGTGNPEAAEIVTGPEGETIVAVSCIQADLDDPEELVLVTLAPGLTCEAPSAEFTAHVYVADHDGNALGTPRRVSSIDTSIAPELRLVERLPITGVASGDATGDGVEDVMIGTVMRTLLMPGRPVNR